MRISFAANHGEIGGGEVMLLAMAKAARELGHHVKIVTPPGKLEETARQEDFRTVTIHSSSTLDYLVGLRRWARTTGPELLWCNGLKPAFATSFLPNRVVHLHSLPTGPLDLLSMVARLRARRVVVPSEWMNSQLGGETHVLANWTGDMTRNQTLQDLRSKRPIRIGFLGRLTSEKGALVLAEAVGSLNKADRGRYQVVVGGASRFTTDTDANRAHSALAQLEPTTEFLGWVERRAFFANVDLAVFPSVFPESFGLVAAEAMASGTPFVITDAGALPEVTAQDERFVARAGDARSLANAIRSAVEAYTPDHVERARALWERQFSPTAGRDRFKDLLDSLETR